MSEEAPASSQESPNEGQDKSDLDQSNIHLQSQKEGQHESDLDQGLEAKNSNEEVSATDSKEVDASEVQPTSPLDNEARLQQLEKEHETLRTQYMRIAADFDNFRKRQTRDQDDLREQLTCTTLSSILPVVDNFERARQQLDPQGEEAQALHRSYQGLYKQLVDVLKQLGVAPMRVLGQSFDPTLHEAVLREPSDEQPEDIIIDELQRGYHLNGRVLRHALVKVSMGPGPQGDNSSDSLKESKEVSENDEIQSTEQEDES